MYKIKIKNIIPPDSTSVYIKHRTYRICIGNGKTFYFTSIREANSFLSQCNKLLNDVLNEVNYLYINLFTEYRRIWFYSDTMDNLEKIQNCIKLIDSNITNSVERCGGINGNHFAWSFLNKAIDMMIDCFNLIIKNNEIRGFYADANRCNLFLLQLKRLLNELNNFGYIPSEDIIELLPD